MVTNYDNIFRTFVIILLSISLFYTYVCATDTELRKNK